MHVNYVQSTAAALLCNMSIMVYGLQDTNITALVTS